jgi:hypothetical protein
VGVGASVSYSSIGKETNAFIADNAVVDALGLDPTGEGGIAGVFSGTDDGTNFITTARHGVIVQSYSTEDIFHLSIAVGAGLVGVSGGIEVTLIDSNTSAYIGANAEINRSDTDNDGIINEGAASNQGVYVNAANKVTALTLAGALGGGFVGVAGAVQVGSIMNDTAARILSGAHVSAAGDVAANGLSLIDLKSYTMSAGMGFVGIGGAISVWSVGTPIQRNYTDNSGATADSLQQQKGKDDPSPTTMDSEAAAMGGNMSSSTAQGLNSIHPGQGSRWCGFRRIRYLVSSP